MTASTSPALQIATTPARIGRAGRVLASQLDLRVSDSERAEVTDHLSRHYGDGRLDATEFGERLDRVMTATTYRDLSGVLEDLPSEVAVPAPAAAARRGEPRPRPRRSAPARRAGQEHLLLRLALVVLVAIVLTASLHAVTWAVTPLLWIGVLGAMVLLAARARARR